MKVLRIADLVLIALSVTGMYLYIDTMFTQQHAPWGPITVITGLILNAAMVVHAWITRQEPVRQYNPIDYFITVTVSCGMVGYWMYTGLMEEALFSYMTAGLAMAMHVIRLLTPRLKAHWA